MAITLVQSDTTIGVVNETSITATFPSGATAGNIIWCAVGIDKSSGAKTRPTGFTDIVDHASTNVSTYVGYKVATGGETAITLSWTTASVAGDCMWIGEYSDSNSGNWTILGSASDLTDDVGRTVTPSGTTAATSAVGRGLAFFTIDTGSNANGGVPTYTNSFTSLEDYISHSGRGDVAVATRADIPQGTTASTTQTHTPTADQTTGVIVVFAKISSATPPPNVVVSIIKPI